MFFETLALLSYDVGTTAALWSALIALLAAGAAGFLNAAKENDGAGSNV